MSGCNRKLAGGQYFYYCGQAEPVDVVGLCEECGGNLLLHGKRMQGYKLLRKRKDGTYGSLFINKRQGLVKGVEYSYEDHPTKGYAHRPGWHVCLRAPHLSEKNRVWCKVEFTLKDVIERPESQGGTWYLGDTMKILEEL